MRGLGLVAAKPATQSIDWSGVAVTVSPICRLPVATREVVLTFDDGPSPYTSELTFLLRREQVRAAFFWLGSPTRPGLRAASRLVQLGHQVESHSVTHRRLTELSDGDVRAEIDRSGRVLAARSGVPIRYFRPPYGDYDARTLTCAEQCGLAVALWDVDTLDWARAKAPARILEAATEVRPGSIILMHERPQTARILPEFIRRVRSAGYGFRLLPDPAAVVPD